MRGGSVSRKETCPHCGSLKVSNQGIRYVESDIALLVSMERRKECQACRTRWITRESFVRVVTPRKRSIL